ncbi:amino acid kinase family protein [[Clostridium] sordellii ATCC 9714]|nr:amino acid kinase family protein [[Clostridium] sordellii ATCC 9714] [Paeniclostridium sordellii ATCC 9714]
MKRLVIALGGNALGSNPEEQLELVKQTAKTIVDLSEEGYNVIVGHGNGPQVGMINLAMDFASSNGANTPSMPFAECGSMSQGYIGYHLQQSIKNELESRKLNKNVSTIVTQVVVDENDEAFKKLTKPVGMFYTKEEAEKISSEKGFTFVEDAGRGYRRVVASPQPQRIVELETVKQLVDNGTIVITVGGGGIPVIEKEDGSLHGVAAVIDKDKSSAKLAKTLMLKC